MVVRILLGVCGLSILLESTTAQAQVPFINRGGAVAFAPEISVVNTGVVNDVQATVSPDRRYVTLNMRPQSTNLLALREFTFQTPSGTGPAAAANVPGGGGQLGAMNAPMLLSPGNGAGLLAQRGMTRVLTPP